MVDQLASRIFIEYQEAIDIQEALKCNNLQDDENVDNASQFSAPHPQPLPHLANIFPNPLSSLTNEVPSLVSKISPKPVAMTKKQLVTPMM